MNTRPPSGSRATTGFTRCSTAVRSPSCTWFRTLPNSAGRRLSRSSVTRLILGRSSPREASSPRPVPARPGRCKPGQRHHEARSSISDRMVMDYPKRLIEVDLPIKRISAHARREKSIRHGHISTLHIWWARRPLAACRAVICASLWPDPADENCPQAFRDAAARLITAFAEKVYNTTSLHATASKESFGQWEGIVAARAKGIDLDPHDPAHLNKFRFALLDFIADFANWDNSTVREYLDTSRALTQAAHEAMGGAPGSRPLVVDPFAGGGSIPLEALRVGADAYASDLNPIPVLLNKVLLEYIPKYGQRLAQDVRKWGTWVKDHAEKELAQFYPRDPDGAIPIAYLWSRTIRCEGPGCGAEVPLIRTLWLARKAGRMIALQVIPDAKGRRVDFDIISKQG